MAQRVWQTLPTWLISTRTSPICSTVPMGMKKGMKPRVVMFSAKSPSFTVRPRFWAFLMDSSASSEIWRCHASLAWASSAQP